jgi:DNA-binding MarR family transcriptional regulator
MPHAAPSEPRSTVSWAGPPSIAPTPQELQISARLLLHIARQPRFDGSMGEAPLALTQAGMAAALGTSQPAVSNSLKRLVDGGALAVARQHVEGQRQRLKVYQLTPTGAQLVVHIRASMRR